jgi:hypothetical protein
MLFGLKLSLNFEAFNKRIVSDLLYGTLIQCILFQKYLELNRLFIKEYCPFDSFLKRSLPFNDI